MNYQEIYQGLHKEASAEQVRQLAAMIKQAGMKKEAAPATPGLGSYLKGFFTGTTKYLPYAGGNFAYQTQKFSLPHAKDIFIESVKKHPKTYAAFGLGIPLAGGSYMLGSAGKSDLKAALDRANATNTKLTEQNKKLQNRGIWDMIL